MLDRKGAVIRGALEKQYILNKVPMMQPMRDVIDEALRSSVRQSMAMAASLSGQPGLLRSVDKNGALVTCTSQWWTKRILPGTLWYLYQYSGNDTVRRYAEAFTRRVEDQQISPRTITMWDS